MNRKVRIVINILIIVSILAVGLLMYRNYVLDNDEPTEEIYVEETVEPTPTPTPTKEPIVEIEPDSEPTPTPKILIPRQEILDLRAEYENDDIVGYLKVNGTSIDYPILQSTSNDYYLERDVYKNDSLAGSIYMDYENNIELDDPSTILYGHNMKADIMFHSIRYYSNKSYYDEHKYIQFDTLYEEGIWEIFSFMKTTTDFNYIQVYFPSEAYAYSLAKEMQSKSVYDTGVEIFPGDRVLVMSTCTDASPTSLNRSVVCARKLSPEEITPEIEAIVYGE